MQIFKLQHFSLPFAIISLLAVVLVSHKLKMQLFVSGEFRLF